MYKKERLFIYLKAAKKVAVPFMLIVCAFTYIFVAYFTNSNAYATEQVANVSYNVSLINNEVAETVSEGGLILTNDETADIELGDVDVIFSARSRLEFDYLIENLVDSDCLFTLNLTEKNLQNMLVQYQVEENIGVLSTADFNIKAGESLKVKVIISIDNLAKDAVLDGVVGLTMVNLGGV